MLDKYINLDKHKFYHVEGGISSGLIAYSGRMPAHEGLKIQYDELHTEGR